MTEMNQLTKHANYLIGGLYSTKELFTTVYNIVQISRQFLD